MESQEDDDEVIKIKPKTKILSAEELTRTRNLEVKPLRTGLKRTQSSGGQEEIEELAKLYTQLKLQILVPRVERLAGRSLAEWDAEKQAVRVTRKDGKFGNFGYSSGGKHYLQYFEALFLLELDRLQLEYDHQVVSVEQAYVLLLGEDESTKYNEYLVYSHFMRVGYILVGYRNLAPNTVNVTPHDCIWALLLQAVRNKPVPYHIGRSPHFEKVKQSMEDIKQSIQQQTHPKEETPSESLNFQCKIQLNTKRKATEMPADSGNKKRHRHLSKTEQIRPQSYVDFLKEEPEYKQFREMFEKFDIIKLKPRDVSSSGVSRKLKINFDVHLHKDGFKKSSPKTPSFRLVILERTDAFPTHAEISQCYNQQFFKVPLLVVSVSESKQIQAFLYFFS